MIRTEMFEQKPWYVTYPSGKEVFVMGLSKFCKDNDLERTHMVKVSQGKRTHTKGFKARKASWADM